MTMTMKMKLQEDENVEGNFKFVMNRMMFFAENINECVVLL